MDALLGEGGQNGNISEDNAIPDFKRALQAASELEAINDAATQMGAIVRSLITNSFGDSKYEQAMECLSTLREEMIELEEPSLYNDFVRDLKKGLLSGALGGDRRDFWFKIRWARMGLVGKEQSEPSEVTHDEAEEVRVVEQVIVECAANSMFSFTSQDERRRMRVDFQQKTDFYFTSCAAPHVRTEGPAALQW